MIILLDYFVSGFVVGVVFRREARPLTGCRAVQGDSCQTQLRTKILYPRLCFLGIADDGRCPETGQSYTALRTVVIDLQKKCRRGLRSRLLGLWYSSTLKMEVVPYSETMVCARPHGVACHRTVIFKETTALFLSLCSASQGVSRLPARNVWLHMLLAD